VNTHMKTNSGNRAWQPQNGPALRDRAPRAFPQTRDTRGSGTALRIPYLKLSLLIALASLPRVGAPALAQRAVVEDAPASQLPRAEAKLVQLKVRPAAEPRPALKYRLLPSVLDQTPGNAEPLYYLAAQLFTDPAKEGFANRLSDWIAAPLGDLPREEVRRALDEHEWTLRELRLATHREWCHWDLPVRSEGLNMGLPALSRFRGLARLLAVKARLEISEHRYDEALDTLQGGFAMARHVSDAPNLIHDLVGAAIASMMADRVAEFVQAPDAPNLYWALAELPRPFVDLRTAVQTEACLLYFTVPELRDLSTEIMTPRQVERLSDKVFRLAGSVPASGLDATNWGQRLGSVAWTIKLYPSAKRHLLALGRSPQEVEAMPVQQVVLLAALDHYDRWRDELFKWFALPYWQGCEGMKEVERRLRQESEVQTYPFTVLLPTLSRAYFSTTKPDRQIAALQCVEAIRMYAAARDGRLPASLAEINIVPLPRDPVTGSNFEYELSGETAALRSPAPAGQPAKDGMYYEITLTK